MTLPESQIESSAAVVEAERDAALARIRDALEDAGSPFCITCGHEIAPARRAALPSAERCISCQTRFERRTA